MRSLSGPNQQGQSWPTSWPDSQCQEPHIYCELQSGAPWAKHQYPFESPTPPLMISCCLKVQTLQMILTLLPWKS